MADRAVRLRFAHRFVEEHHLDEFEIVEGTDYAGGDADGRQDKHVGLDCSLEDNELAPEAEQRRDARQTEHQQQHAPGDSRAYRRQASDIGKCLELFA